MLGRQDCYRLLLDIKNTGVDTNKYFLQLAQSSEVPVEVIRFINSNRALVITSFYEDIRKLHNQRKSKLYIDIMRELDPDELLITISSIITRAFIFGKTLSTKDKIQFFKNAKIVDIIDAIKEYTITSDISKCNEIISKIKSDIKVLETYKE